MFQQVQPQFVSKSQQSSSQLSATRQQDPSQQFAGHYLGTNGEESKKKRTFAGRMDELNNIPPEKEIFVFGIEFPKTGITNLNQEAQIHSTFGSPFAENPQIKTDALNFVIPGSYNKPQVSLSPVFIKKFPDETLFYIFYNLPEEAHQSQAVLVLYERGWQYNMQSLTWMRNIEDISNNLYKCEIFSIKEWKVLKMEQIAMNLKNDIASLTDFAITNTPSVLSPSTTS